MTRCAILSLCIAVAQVPVRADAPAPPTRATATKVGLVDLPSVFEWVELAVEFQEWRNSETADLESWVARLVEGVRRAGGRATPLPVRFAALRAGTSQSDIGELADRLYIGKGTEIHFADRCIVLADGPVKIRHANDCLIIATGAVEIAHSRRNIVLAAQSLEVDFDGQATGIDDGSLLVSGGTLSVSRARGSQLSAPELVEVGIATSCRLINTPNCKIEEKLGVNQELTLPGQLRSKRARPLLWPR